MQGAIQVLGSARLFTSSTSMPKENSPKHPGIDAQPTVIMLC